MRAKTRCTRSVEFQDSEGLTCSDSLAMYTRESRSMVPNTHALERNIPINGGGNTRSRLDSPQCEDGTIAAT